MAVDGLWVLEVTSEQPKGSGVVSLQRGMLLGGDSDNFYKGRYWIDDSNFKALVDVHRFGTSQGPMFGVQGVRNIAIEMTGVIDNDAILARATINRPSSPSRFFVRLRQVVEDNR